MARLGMQNYSGAPALRYRRAWLYGLYPLLLLIIWSLLRFGSVFSASDIFNAAGGRLLRAATFLFLNVLLPYLVGVGCSFYALFLLRRVSRRAEKVVLLVGWVIGALISTAGTLVGGLLGVLGITLYGLMPFGILLSLLFGILRLIRLIR